MFYNDNWSDDNYKKFCNNTLKKHNVDAIEMNDDVFEYVEFIIVKIILLLLMFYDDYNADNVNNDFCYNIYRKILLIKII